MSHWSDRINVIDIHPRFSAGRLDLPAIDTTKGQSLAKTASGPPHLTPRPPPASMQGRVYHSGRAEISPDVQLYAQNPEVLGTGGGRTTEYPRRHGEKKPETNKRAF